MLSIRSLSKKFKAGDLVRSVPRLADRYLLWKLGVSLLGGTVLAASAATALGSLAGTGVRLFYLALASGLMLVAQLVYRARAR